MTAENFLPKGILIDMDDTIIADDPCTETAWKTACDQFSSVTGGISSEELYKAIKEASAGYWSDPVRHRQGRLNLIQARREVVILAFSRLGFQDNRMALKLADTFSAEKERLIAPFPGALETLKILKERNIGLALLTNGGAVSQRKKIERFELAKFFDYILIEGEFGAGKPEKQVFQAVLSGLGITSAEAWMVGDDLHRDIAGAQQMGIYSVWINGKGEELPPASEVQPDRIINSLPQLLNR